LKIRYLQDQDKIQDKIKNPSPDTQENQENSDNNQENSDNNQQNNPLLLEEFVSSENEEENKKESVSHSLAIAPEQDLVSTRTKGINQNSYKYLSGSNSLSDEMNLPPPASISLKKVKIKDIKAGQYVLSLDESTGKLVPRKVNALLDHGIKPIYEMATEDGRAINTTAEHPYLAKLYSKEDCDKYSNDVWNKEADEFNGYCIRWVEIKDLYIVQSLHSNPSSSTMNILPLNSLTSAKREDNADVNFSTVGGWIKNTAIPQNSFGGNIALFRKSESLESKTKDFSLASEANLPFLVPLAAYSAESPLDARNSLISILMFSSSRNFSEPNITFSADGLGSILQGVSDHFLSDAGVTSNNAFYAFPGSDQFNNITNQNPSALKSRLSMADFAVRNYELANFDSHINNNDNLVFKGFEIAVPDYESRTIRWQKVSSIKTLDPQHVYDLSIEGTRNFIANDIVAHNTYLATSSGNVGIGTTNPASKLQVAGSFNATNGVTGMLVTSDNNVVIHLE